MKKKRIIRIQDLVGLMNALYPQALAEDWDNVGLHVGDPRDEVRRVLVALDPAEWAIEAAVEQDAQLLITHHPLIFRPLKSLQPLDEVGRTLFAAIRNRVAVFCAHTNLDRARNGLNDWLAATVGLKSWEPLLLGSGDLFKLVVFVPHDHQEAVAEALFSAGAGHIGNYDCCSFGAEGQGTYRPGAGSNPFQGEIGQLETAAEIRLETVVPQENLPRVINKMLKAHPYEEVAYDVVALGNQRPDVGLGRIGELPEAISLDDLAVKLKEVLDGTTLRVAGDGRKEMKKIAVCGGSGISVLREAARRGADVLVTGDVKYHDAQLARELGVALIDAGHFGSEHLMVRQLAATLQQAADERGLDIDFLPLEGEADLLRQI